MDNELQRLLERHFGFAEFRAGQMQVMKSLLAGRSALALFPTGAGKSLCYQLPALLMDGVTLVISPLIALMKDQVEALQARGIAAARLDSSLSQDEVQAVFEQLRAGTLKLLYVAPERLLKESFVERLKRLKVAMMAIDEAHCISEWGHSFRPEYLRLAHVAKELGIHPVLALTATATPEVAADIRRAFQIEQADHAQTSFLRSNLHFRITPCATERRLPLLAKRLKERSGAAVVYVTLQMTAEQVATYLQRAGVRARAYHAGMPAEHRSEAQEAFMHGEVDVIVATIAFGMGIDKADIRAVYHYNLPKTIENYQQETGRAGRDGKVSVCEMFACEDDCVVLENFVYGDTPTASALKQLVDHLLRKGQEFDVSLYDLSQATDIRPMVIETVITYMELEGLLRPLGSFYATYQFQLLQDEKKVLAGYKPERQAFLKRLFASGKRGYKWTTIDPELAATEIGEDRERILKALTWLEEAGEILLRPSGSRQRYRLSDGVDGKAAGEVAVRLAALFTRREERDIARLRQVLEVASQPGCLTQWLLSYFGEKQEALCCRCESCLEERSEAREIPVGQRGVIGGEALQVMHELIKEQHPALRQARQIARFMCGLTSPATSRAKLGKHDAFGMLERVRFAEVLEQVEALVGAS
jgi:ATP-dependent DNA helicase RecQ